MSSKIGFMQGRLSPLVNGQIQAFPLDEWETEFELAESIGISCLEWTIDNDTDWPSNPFLTVEGRERIKTLQEVYKMSIPSVTGDCFMQFPFWKLFDEDSVVAWSRFNDVVESAIEMQIGVIVVPLVDNGSINKATQEEKLFDHLLSLEAKMKQNDLRIAFESDLPPARLKEFIDPFPSSFGINYDIGNSAGLGFEPAKELEQYSDRIINVHIKDRVLGGSTVPLGQGNANFDLVYKLLAECGYSGRFILQTARDPNNDHFGAIKTYFKSTLAALKKWDLL